MASLLPSAGAPRKAPPALPLVTYFLNAGLSPRDAQDAARELLARVRSRILRLAATHTLEEQRRYVADWPYREQLNARLIAEEILLMRFSGDELRVIDEGLQLGIAPREGSGRTARVFRDGVLVDELDVDRIPTRLEDLRRLKVRSKRTGKTFAL